MIPLTPEESIKVSTPSSTDFNKTEEVLSNPMDFWIKHLILRCSSILTKHSGQLLFACKLLH